MPDPAPEPHDRRATGGTHWRPSGVERVVAVGSGKGGVGKSTVAVNLALGLVRRGFRVGLFDADVHGPNVPLMLGVRRRADAAGWAAIVPVAYAGGEAEPNLRLPPLERYGLKVMSLGLLAGEDQALLADNAALVGLLVRGLVRLVDWGELDLLLIDLPPGTGEPQSTLLAAARLDGAVLVVTPQDVARLDTTRALAAFRTADVPIVGLVENMSFLSCPHCGGRIDVFHRGGVSRAIEGNDVPLLAEIPIDLALSEAADTGRPLLVSAPAGEMATRFLALASRVADRLGLRPPGAASG